MNKEPRLRFTDEERSDPALEKPIRKAEKAAARADKAQANIPKKKVRQTVIDPDTGKKTSKLTFEDKKKPPSKVSQGVREAPVHLVAGKLHKEIRETEQDNVGVESAHKSEEAVETGAYLVREGYRSHKLKPYRKAAQAERQLEKANVNVLYQKSLQENPQFASNPSFPLAAKAGHQKAVCRRQTRRSDCRKYRPGCIQNRKSRKDGKRKGTAGRGIRHAPQEGFPDGRGFVPHYLYADEYHVLLLHDGAEHRFRSLRHHLSVG